MEKDEPRMRGSSLRLSVDAASGGDAGGRRAMNSHAAAAAATLPAPAAAAGSEADEEQAGPSTSSSSSSCNAVGTALVIAIPCSRLARFLWRRRATLAGVALAGPGVLGRGLAKTAVAALVASLLPGGWKAVQGLALVGCVPPGAAGLQLHPAVRSAALAARTPALVATLGPPLLFRAAPDVARTLWMWTMFLPLYARYRYTKWRYQEARGYTWPEVESAWNARHEWGAVHVHDMLLRLSGYYVKSAQVLASKGDFIPIQWVVPLTAMFDAMPPRPWKAVRADLDDDVASTPLGLEIAAERRASSSSASSASSSCRPPPPAVLKASDVFASVDTVPLATASIAQVHAAELAPATLARLGWRWAGGSARVVLKVQNEGMRALMDSDCRNLQRLASFVGDIMPFDVAGLLSEMRQTIPKEFDFVREARLQGVMGGRLARDGFAHIAVPRPCAALTTRRLLVMERLDGVSLAAVIRGEGGGTGVDALAAARAAVTSLVASYGSMLFRHGLFHADPHAGNILLLKDDSRGSGQVGATSAGPGTATPGAWLGRRRSNHPPPPPKMALLDFGQVKAIAAPRRVGLARLVLAMDDGLPVPILDALIAMGLNPSAGGDGAEGEAAARPDPLLAAVLAAVVFDTAPLPAAAVNPLDETGRSVLKLAPVRAFPPDLFQVGRTIMILRGLCHAVGADVSATTLWVPWAQEALADAHPVERALQNKAWDNGDDHPDEDEGLEWGVSVVGGAA